MRRVESDGELLGRRLGLPGEEAFARQHAGPIYLSVEPILPGVGTING
jgi:hypothetical protein